MKRKTSLFLLIVLSLFLVGCSSDPSLKNVVASSVATHLNQTSETPSTNPISSNEGTLDVYFLNVGQGDSTLIITPNKNTILIDGGNPEHGNTVVEDLKKYDVRKIDVMIATHPDSDHIGGLADVLQSVPVESVYAPKIMHNTETYKRFITAVKDAGLHINVAQAGVTLPLSGVSAVLVAPVKTYGEDTNPWSAVLHLQYGKNSFLFTGDAPIESEKDMIASGQNLQADVLKLGHHGSSTSSSIQFLRKVNPRFGIISVGKDNPYHLPSPSTITKLKKLGITIYRTDEQGTIEAIGNAQTISFKTNQ